MSVEVITTEKRRAKRLHQCTWCGQRIEIGETYTHERVKVDGDMCINKLHPECDQALSDLATAEGGTCTYDPFSMERPPRLQEAG